MWGYVFEVCFYVENLVCGFLLLMGMLKYLWLLVGVEFDIGVVVCVDSGVCEGDVIMLFYDLMIVKLIVYGVDCVEVLGLMLCVLCVCEVVGLYMNVVFL